MNYLLRVVNRFLVFLFIQATLHYRMGDMKQTLIVVFVLVLAFPCSGLALSQKGDLTVISTEEVKACLDKRESVLLIDTMPRIVHQIAHIPGSINIPLDHIETQLPVEVPDKGQQIIFYCMGPK